MHVHSHTEIYICIYIGCRPPPRGDASGSQKGSVKQLCRIWEPALKAMQSLSCPSKHSLCALLLPGWDPGAGHCCPAAPQLPQPRKWHTSHPGWSQKNTCTSLTGDWKATLRGGSAGSRPAGWEQLCVFVFLGAGGCATRGHQASQGPCPLCWAWGCVTGTQPMCELVRLAQIQTLPALSGKRGMGKIPARRAPGGGAAVSAHVNSKMFTFTFKGSFNSFNCTTLHVSMWHSPWHCLQGLGLTDFTLGRCWAGEGICSVTFDVRHSPG